MVALIPCSTFVEPVEFSQLDDTKTVVEGDSATVEEVLFKPQTRAPWYREYVKTEYHPDGDVLVASNSVVYLLDGQVFVDDSADGLNVVERVDFTGEGFVVNCAHQHGNNMAHTIGGRKVGVAPNVPIVGVKIFPCSETGKYGSQSLLNGLEWVLANHDAGLNNIVNMSLVLETQSEPVSDAVDRLVAAGVKVVVAAGNEPVDACTVAVGAHNSKVTVVSGLVHDVETGEVVRSHTNGFGECVDVWMPANNVHTYDGYRFNGETVWDIRLASGTSVSAAMFSGVLALQTDLWKNQPFNNEGKS